MPCAAPPSSCPMTIIGLTTRPTSLTDQYAATSTAPVSGSTSTSQMWQPLGHVGPATELVESRTICRDGCFREIEQADLPVGARDAEDAIGIFDVGSSRLELFG